MIRNPTPRGHCSPRGRPQIGQDIAQLIPELRPSLALPAALAIPAPNPEQARFRLFESVTSVLRNSARLKPLVVTIDDLHEADHPSLLMLKFAARQLRDTAVLLIGTCREAEVRRSPALSGLVGELAREGTQIALFGLGRENVARMIEERAGVAPNPRIVSDIHQATGGNPLFIDGLARVLAAQGRLSASDRLDLAAFRIPEGVREAIRQWLAMVSAPTPLIVAATIGQEFELDCLQRVTQLSSHQFGRCLTAGVRHRNRAPSRVRQLPVLACPHPQRPVGRTQLRRPRRASREDWGSQLRNSTRRISIPAWPSWRTISAKPASSKGPSNIRSAQERPRARSSPTKRPRRVGGRRWS